MVKGGDELARGRIPELCGFIRARCQDPSTVWTERRVVNRTLMGKGGDELPGGRIPEPGGLVPARRQDSSTIRTKGQGVDRILVVKRGNEAGQRLFTMNN